MTNVTRQPLTPQRAAELVSRSTDDVCSSVFGNDVLLSVCLVTYDHADFINQALEGVYIQETAFPIEVVIGEDCSSDGTTEIVLEHQRRHPENTHVLLAKENLGRHTGNGRLNFFRTLQACRGRFVALLEGDDYWTDPKKLQKQVEYLESHDDCAACFHPVVWGFEQKESEQRISPIPSSDDIDLGDVLSGRHVVHTCSLVLRRSAVRNLPDWFFDAPVGDVPLLFILRKAGAIGVIPDVMAHYRVQAGGVWQMKSDRYKIERLIPLFERLRDLFPDYEEAIDYALVEHRCHLLGELTKDGEHDKAYEQFLAAAPSFLRQYEGVSLSDALFRLAQRCDEALFDRQQMLSGLETEVARLRTPVLIRFWRSVSARMRQLLARRVAVDKLRQPKDG